MTSLADCVRQMRAAVAPLARILRDLSRLFTTLTSPTRPARHRLQPRTLHAALAANPRPALQVHDRRPTRTPATRRR